ncbi:MAG: flagellar hook capping FlgD N-terminal domain-containing protein [Syntrophobacteraceae bacterium]
MSTTSTTSTQSVYGIGSALTSSTSGSSSSSANIASSLDANSFMKLFLTELQNQDPTNPMESYQLAAQLAQFTTVEQLSQANTYLNNLQQYSADINNGEISSLVGKEVTAQTSELDVSSGSVSELDYTLPGSATVTITIKDSNGNKINTLDLGTQSAGSYTVPWTGKNSSGSTVSDGAYTCTVTAVTSNGVTSTVQPTVTGEVYSCNLGNSPPTYTLTGPNGIQVKVSNISGVTSQSSTN